MTGFKLGSSCIGSNHASNSATTTAPSKNCVWEEDILSGKNLMRQIDTTCYISRLS